MGFGHRVYKNFDPRAEIIKKHVEEVFEVTGKNPKLDIAVELEKRALDDEYFIERKLYPNVDFYSGLIYEALNLPPDMFTVMFAIPRTSGWVAQWLEMVTDPETKIARPRQIYTGAREQSYVEIGDREKRSEPPSGRSCHLDDRPREGLDPEHGHEALLVLGLDLGDDLHVLLDSRAAELRGEQLVDLEQPRRVVHRDPDLDRLLVAGLDRHVVDRRG